MVQKFVENNLAKNVTVISRSSKNNYENLNKFKDYNVIINATPVGMYPDNLECKLDLNIFKSLESVVDLIYNPLNTKLILDAKKLGLKTMSGLLMLVAQAFYAAEIFLNEKLDENLIEEMYSKIKRNMENIISVSYTHLTLPTT